MPGSNIYGRHLKLGEKTEAPLDLKITSGVVQRKTLVAVGPISVLKVLQLFYSRQEVKDSREAHILVSFHTRGIHFTTSKAVPW